MSVEALRKRWCYPGDRYPGGHRAQLGCPKGERSSPSRLAEERYAADSVVDIALHY